MHCTRIAAPRASLRCLAVALLIALALAACGGSSAPLEATLPPLAVAEAAPAPPIENDYFNRDHTGALTEEDLRALLAAPVFLADETRLGIVPVAVAYEADEEVPLVGVPEVLAEALDNTGFFEVTSEVSTDWPSDRSISGLRELAARYQTRYLLLYRHRFVERRHVNAWSAAWLTVVAIPFVPSQTLETAGVLEATLFDVQTGTLLFTVYERVHAISDENVWGNERKLRRMRERLLDDGAEALADKVVHQVHQLVAARPVPAAEERRVTLEPEVREGDVADGDEGVADGTGGAGGS